MAILACALASILSGCTAAANSQNSAIVFNEIVSSNSHSLTDPALGSPDWIELYNSSNKDINLSGYKLVNKNETKSYTFGDVTLPSNSCLLIYACENNQTKNGACCTNYRISKDGETLLLVDSKNNAVSKIIIPALQSDVSYARRDNGTYGYCTNTTPGSKNNSGSIMNLEKLQAVLQFRQLTITEVLPKNSGGYAWAKLYNSGDTAIDLNDLYISNEQRNRLKWRLPKQTLKTGEYCVVHFSGLNKENPEMHASFELNKDDIAVYLYDAAGNLISEISWNKDIQNDVSVVQGGLYNTSPSMEKKNSGEAFSSAPQSRMDSSDPVRLNELLINNNYSIRDSDGDRMEWVELFNSSSDAMPLKGYYLSDNKDKPFKWPFPDINIGPKSYLIVFLSGKESKNGELHASFRLSDGETGIYLTNRNNLRFDAISLPEKIGDNISLGPDLSGKLQYYRQATPGKPNSKGFDNTNTVGYFDQTGIYISEVSSVSKARTNQNDWVELHNASDAAVNLAGYYLSDDKNNIKKWQIPSLNIEANGYAVIEASSNAGNQNKNTASFGISPGGETIFFSDPQGNTLDIFETGVLNADVTSGRIEENNTIKRVFFKLPTKGKINSKQTLSGYAAKPLFSDSALYHTRAFTLTLSCSTPGTKIYYTLDGSIPTQNSIAYIGPINISKNAVVRAITCADGFLPSGISTVTYLFDTPHTVPVVCITGEPGSVRRVLHTDSKSRTESSVNIEYYEPNGSLGISFPAGLRAKGKASLRLAQNSLTVALRSNYGVKSVTYPFYVGSDHKTYTTLSLRNSGQDITGARLRDSFFQKVSKGLNIDNIETRTVVAYVNGVYWGIYDLNEEQNEDYLSSHYGIDTGNIDKINGNGKVMEGNKSEFNRISKIARTWNLKDDKVFAEFSKYVDTDACIDYLVMQIYFGNGDVVNNRFWRTQDYSVKWRPLLFDLDFCLRFNDVNRNVFRKYLTRSPSIGAGLTVRMDIFSALYQNKAWRDKFIERFVELAETKFKPERILTIYDEMVKTMQPEMARQIERWHRPGSMAAWENQLERLRSTIEKRRDVVLRQLQDYFNVPDSTLQEYIKKYSVGN